MLRRPDPVSIGRGATLAQPLRRSATDRKGVSDANSPNLGRPIRGGDYKELTTSRRGPRQCGDSPFRGEYDQPGHADLAPFIPTCRGAVASSERHARTPLIVTIGAPMRNIAPCAPVTATSTTSRRSVARRPVRRLHQGAAAAFATGARRIDISQQMRNIAAR